MLLKLKNNTIWQKNASRIVLVSIQIIITLIIIWVLNFLFYVKQTYFMI